MSTSYSRDVEDFQKFENHGSRVMYERAAQHITSCRSANQQRRRCERHQIWLDDVASRERADDALRLPLDGEPTDDEIAAVCQHTSCTVLESSRL